MTAIENALQRILDDGFPAIIVDAPKDAIRFDKFLVVYSDETKKTIRQVHFYSTKENKFIGSV